jgi:hypothetical protein
MLKGGVLAYSIKWKGWDSKHNTMEPLCNLPEVTAEIAAFEKREAKRQKDLDAVIARREAAKAARDEKDKEDDEKQQQIDQAVSSEERKQLGAGGAKSRCKSEVLVKMRLKLTS